MKIDGETIESDNVFITISNSCYTGTHFLIAPSAVIDDGLLDVTVLRKLKRWRILRLFPTIYDGRHVDYEEISTHKASRIDISAPAAMPLSPDGELCGQSPAGITCLHQDLDIYY